MLILTPYFEHMKNTMNNQVIVRNRKNASTLFKGIPSKFKYLANGKYFPYSKEAYESLN